MTYLGFIRKEDGYTITTQPQQAGTPIDRIEFATALADMIRIYNQASEPLREPTTHGLSVAENDFVYGLHDLLNGVKRAGGIHTLIPGGSVLDHILREELSEGV